MSDCWTHAHGLSLCLPLQVPTYQNTGLNVVNSADPSARQEGQATPTPTLGSVNVSPPLAQSCTQPCLAIPKALMPMWAVQSLLHINARKPHGNERLKAYLKAA